MTTATKDRVTKKKLTVAQAAEQWETSKRLIEEHDPLLKEAAAVLKEHFEKTGRSTYKDRIAYAVSTRKVLDQAAVTEYLGAQIEKYKKRVTIQSLTLLKK